MDTIKEKLRKIYQLTQRGADGERENAQRALDALLAKYDLTISDVADEERSSCRFDYKLTIHKKLLRQIVAAVTQTSRFAVYTYKYGRAIGFDLTKAEEVEVRFLFAEYARAWAKEQDDLMTAFCMKHRLLAPADPDGPEPTKEEWEEYMRLQNAASSMKDVNLKRKRINA